MSDDGQNNELSSRLEDLKYLYENAACGYLTINAQAGIERINTTALTWFGYAEDEITNLSAVALVAPDDRKSFLQAIQSLPAAVSALANPSSTRSPASTPMSLHIHLSTRSGTTFPSLLHLSPGVTPHQSQENAATQQIDIAIFHLGQQESLLDVLTNTRARLENANAQAQRADSRLEVIAQTTPDAIITMDAQQIVIFANPAAESMFKLNRASIVGAPIDQLIPTQARDRHRSHVIQFGRDGNTRRKMAGHLQVEGRRQDGTHFPVDASISHYFIDGVVHYTAILRDVSERDAADKALAKVREQVRRYAARLRSVREDEQKRISRELHDDIGQKLAALKLDIYTCESELKTNSAKAAEKLAAIGSLTSDIISDVRAMASQLRPKVLDELGLAPALEIYLADLGTRYSIAHTLELDPDLALPEKLSTEIFRLVQEATHNIVKHAKASKLSVTVNLSDDGVHVSVEDNGQGITQEEPRHDALGLIGMQERVNSLGGQLRVESYAGRGTLVKCVLPPLNNRP